MKRYGFTLAEILVALGVIGVVSALAMPTFMSNTQTKSHQATLKTTVTAIENAIGSILAQDAANTIGESTLVDNFMPKLNEVLKSSESGYSPVEGSTARLLKNGSVASFVIDDIDAGAGDVAGTVTIDTNGEARPNRNNIDIFTFNLMGNGNLELQE